MFKFKLDPRRGRTNFLLVSSPSDDELSGPASQVLSFRSILVCDSKWDVEDRLILVLALPSIKLK